MLYSIYLRTTMPKLEKLPKLQKLPKVICTNRLNIAPIINAVNGVRLEMYGSRFSNMKSHMQWEPAKELMDETQTFGQEKLEDLKKQAVAKISGLACEQTIQMNGETIVCNGPEYDGDSAPRCPLKDAVEAERMTRRTNRINRRNLQSPNPTES